MVTQDSFKLCDSSYSEHGSEIYDPFQSAFEVIESDSQPPNSRVIDKALETMVDGLPVSMDASVRADFEKKPGNSSTMPLPSGIQFTESVVSEHAENGSLAVQSKSGFDIREEDGILMSKRPMDDNLVSSVNKRPRITVDEYQQPSVHVAFNLLTSESKRKLEELLQQWSQWHSQSCSLSDDLNVTLESGTQTFFPALRPASDKPSDVAFWIDIPKAESDKEFIPLDGTSVPLYDRGYSLPLSSVDGSSKMDRGVPKLDSSRCFNCGSYDHALKECSKPRDNVAVNNARKEHKAKRNQHANSRNSIRYYQSSRGGKYDGLAPGGLSADTRCALGLGELDPPPWLNRMREIGYPPGYLTKSQDEDDQPSGIRIFGDVENEEKIDRGEILDASITEPSRKMTIEFPGVNAPIPENADKRLWATSSPSKFHQSRESSHRKISNHLSENWSRRHNTERRWERDLEDDGPPGCDSRASPSMSNNFRRYGDRDRDFSDYSHSPRASLSERWTSSYDRSYSDNGRRSPLVHGGFSPPNSDYSPIPRYNDRNYGYSAFSPRASPSIPLSPSYGRSYLDRGRRSPLVYEGSLNNRWTGTYPYSSPR